jgi:hypothetical protein
VGVLLLLGSFFFNAPPLLCVLVPSCHEDRLYMIKETLS